MEKCKYHHGNLKKDMIKNGLQLLTTEGYEAFSLRKVAKMCGVSHTAPYKHFKNKDELISAIIFEATQKFKKSLEETSIKYQHDFKTQVIEVGKRYIQFMVENPDYFKVLFINNLNNKIIIQDKSMLCIQGDSFNPFKNTASSYLSSLKTEYSDKDLNLSILSIWSTIHGLAALLSNKTIIYSGDYLELAENIIRKNLNCITDSL
ncbi:AcrR family transcriptional regulator [Clostridium acetobutylicum]|uniref:Transcriptional regulators, AcrR family n=1 Tax=Clostridium acetobutylicum (strain ATCC 824 / DSM 792 / JCM 1419 / IAM 19013 / LMG 5710 / NBRC 13948 / NRRL B-527 / VKM B-1787 / 2291 / W) TaxID=272562 RepID=Q97FG6_CLOAB|nr:MULTISPECIES: TetR/AcrR family transcriptional regulator [Clostridium]AAK80717.1 Transcriptional regulators, AcrR family [Clostridium acetobutylicum ATCC 824]ADZ21818.1 Transcriptional regulator, AcrR family [Clostridium acetobutylicum EA 2018]AEI32540.1 AcrR family transcriptional regulator [Clostridium acetobutylicum DSM 1731]AWV78869.1 TetR/AcrR family transcriptional regulator [Clostridium acetobutylicum]MBC2395106.1 TetR/AcrR family transcriptional regulator [Clostridium acetobutylicum